MTPALLVLLLAAGAAPVTNAQVSTRSATGGLAPAMEAALRGRPDAQWIGYAVPSARSHRLCCGDGSYVGEACCGGCRLEQGNNLNLSRDQRTAKLEGDDTGIVLARAERGRVGKIRMFSSGCALDAGGLPFVWLTGVDPAESLRWLAPFAERAQPDAHKSLADGALMAIAFHAGEAADDVLAAFTRPDRSAHVRRQAAFWLGNARGRRGYEVLARMMRHDPHDEVRAHVTFALSQSEVPEALTEMIRAARHDESGRVRGQALFWLAQKAGRKASAAITGAIDADPDTQVKEQAVFALSQLPKAEGVPLLIDVARTHRNRRVREKAMFWLGQSNDDRALAFIEDVLTR